MSLPLEKIKESLMGLIEKIEETGPGRLVAKAEPKALKPIFERLLNDFKEDFYLDFVTAVDYPEEKEFEIDYGIWMYSLKISLMIRFRLPRRKPLIDTLSDLIPSATNHEKEIFDLMGIKFRGNPGLKRGFLVTEELIDTFPLRKSEATKG